MIRLSMASEPGDIEKPNEDWVAANPTLIVVLDGSTSRTDTGCVHGVSWYAAMLGTSIVANAAEPSQSLSDSLRNAITHVAKLHPECDLDHVGTPSAFVAVVRLLDRGVEHLVLGDAIVALDTDDGIQVIQDDRVEATARPERTEADRYPIGTDEKQAALVLMKQAELAARNRSGGFWAATSDPAVVDRAIIGQVHVDQVVQLAVLTDGAARITTPFDLLDWQQTFDLLARTGPTELIRRVRAAESADPDGTRWPRNKASDDATVVYFG
jgi:hypothetical protein